MTAATVAYTDGACERNPGGRGGWGLVVDANTFGLGGDPSTTNQRMEIRAALEAARALPRPLTVWSDSKYVVACFDKAWWRKWRANGWKTSQKQPVANRDLWEPLVEVASADVTFRWVKGHSGVNLKRGGGPAGQRGNAGRGRHGTAGPRRDGGGGSQGRTALRGACHVERPVQGVRRPLHRGDERHEERPGLGAREVRCDLVLGRVP